MFLALIVIICIFAILQNDGDRRKVALLYALAEVSHYAFYDNVQPDIAYYVTAGMCASVPLIVLCLGVKPSNFATKMIAVLGFSILINLYGLAIYDAGWDPDSYNIACRGLIVLAVITMIKGGGCGSTITNWLYKLISFGGQRRGFNS